MSVDQHCSLCGIQSSTLERCGACRNDAYCGRDCQQAAWPNHKRECKIGGAFKKQLLKGLSQELPVSVRRDHSEKSLLYLRDKFPNARELHSSGLCEILHDLKTQHDPRQCKTKGCWLCPSVTTVVDEILGFASEGTHGRAMSKLRALVSQGQGTVCYYPGAMLDLSQPLAAIGASQSITHLVCVSSFEVDTIERMFGPSMKKGDTEAFCSQIQAELQGSSLVLKSTLISDSRLHADSNALGPIRLEYQVILRGERVKAPGTPGAHRTPGEVERTIRVIYYVNEDFCSFWPPEVTEGSISVLYSPKTCLPLWEQEEGGWVESLKGRTNPSTLFISDSTTVCEPPLLFFFLAAAEGGRGSQPLPQSVIEEHLSEAFVLPLMTTLPLLSVTEDLIAHSKKSGQGGGGGYNEEGFNVRILCAWRLDQVLVLAAKAVRSVLDESSKRSRRKPGGTTDKMIMEDTRRLYREFLTTEFATVVRVDGFKRLPASSSMAALLRHHLTHDPVESIKDSLPDWRAQAIRQLRIAVGLEG